MRILFFLLAGVAIVTPAQAGTTYVDPDGSGGYVVTSPPSDWPTYIDRNGDGSYTVLRPGRSPTYIDRDGRGFVITTPPEDEGRRDSRDTDEGDGDHD